MYDYKDLKEFSKSIGIPAESLVKAFEIEKEFHDRILKEKEKNKNWFSFLLLLAFSQSLDECGFTTGH